MKFIVAAVGQRMPGWVNEAWSDFARRFPPSLPLELKEIRMPRRTPGADIAAAMKVEGEALRAAVPEGALTVALDLSGKQWSTEELAAQLENWMLDGRDVAFFIGGPNGLSEECLASADLRWSFGRSTFPHMLVRVMLAEQLYRAWSVTQNHPYHRA